jgi:RNA polymerase sigma factor (sigma-70 family)
MSLVNGQTDASLVRECLGGHQRAFDTLVKKYEKPIYNVALRMLRDPDDAMDVAQSTFVKAYEKLGTFDQKREFFSWLYRIAINESINASKRTKRMDEYESGKSATLAPKQEAQRDLQMAATRSVSHPLPSRSPALCWVSLRSICALAPSCESALLRQMMGRHC